MKLHSSLGPNPRLVRMALAEKGIEVERRHYDIVAGENRQDAAYAKLNPTGTMPALELNDGTVLTESTAICEYLEEVEPDPPLIGTDPAERAQTRRWVRLIDQEIVVPMTMGFRATAGRPMFEPRLRVVDEAAGRELSAYADASWRWLDGELAGRDHLCHARLTLADLVAFNFYRFGLSVGWTPPEGTADLARFVERIGERPSARIWQEKE